MRGSDMLAGEHSFKISDRGIEVFPRIEALLAEPSHPDQAGGETISLGIPELDMLLGSGPVRRSVTLVLGSPGSGKTTTGLHFLSVCSADEPGLLFGFHENPAAVAVKAERLGLGIDKLLRAGHVSMVWQPSTEALVDEVCNRLLGEVRRRKVKRLFLDGLDGLKALTIDPGRLENLVTALCNELRALGVSTLVTAETELAGIIPGQPLAGLFGTGLSPIAENVVVLRLAALRSELHRLLLVVKARDSGIDLRMRSFEITDRGIVIQPDFSRAESVLRDLALQGHAHAAATTSASGGA
jgi:circadian clock protein KaiC